MWVFFIFLPAFVTVDKCEQGYVERLNDLKKCRTESPG